MVRAIKELVTVQPDGHLEIRRADLPPGALVEVILMYEESDRPGSVQALPSLSSLFGKVHGCFRDGAEADAFLRAERDKWSQ